MKTDMNLSKVNITPLRQSTQYNCMTISAVMSLRSLGVSEKETSFDLVNQVMGATPMRGASWESALSCFQHYGMRTYLICPGTLSLARAYLDRGCPIMIAWNLGNEWSHASVLFGISDTQVWIADPNCPNPAQLVRILTHDEFYEKWWEMSPQGYKIRRPMMAIEREITEDGRQRVASRQGTPLIRSASIVASRYLITK